MWKEKLPTNCPPESACEIKTVAYRFLINSEPQESDFLPYAHMYPENVRYKTLCEAFSVSSFDSIQHAIEAWKRSIERGKNIGNFIARIQIEPTDGQNKHNKYNGHISTWLYASRTSNKFDCRDIKVINEN